MVSRVSCGCAAFFVDTFWACQRWQVLACGLGFAYRLHAKSSPHASTCHTEANACRSVRLQGRRITSSLASDCNTAVWKCHDWKEDPGIALIVTYRQLHDQVWGYFDYDACILTDPSDCACRAPPARQQNSFEHSSVKHELAGWRRCVGIAMGKSNMKIAESMNGGGSGAMALGNALLE